MVGRLATNTQRRSVRLCTTVRRGQTDPRTRIVAILDGRVALVPCAYVVLQYFLLRQLQLAARILLVPVHSPSCSMGVNSS